MTLQLNSLTPAPGSHTKRTRVGRGIGSGLGKTAGRGHKGSFARKGGGKIKAGFEGGQTPMQRRLPKVGFHSARRPFHAEVLSYRLNALESGDVTLATLRQAQLISAKVRFAKVVMKGNVTKSFHLRGIRASANATAAIQAAGGSIQE